jgi:C-terminal processing protease CtpA/Prc
MTRRIVSIVPLLAIGLLVGVPTRSLADDPQKPSNDNQASSNQEQQQSSDNTNGSQSTQSDKQSNQTNASSQSLPTPSNSDAKGEANRSDNRSVLKDNNTADRTQAPSRDNAARDRSIQPSQANDRDRMQRDFRSGIKIGRSTDRGLTVNSVVHNSIFFESGLRDSDIIVSINGRPVRSEAEFDRVVVFEPGRRIPFVVFRNGRQQTIYVTFRQQTPDVRNVGNYFGAEFDPQIADAAVISRVDEGSPADRAGLRQNDLIVSLNGQRVSSPNDAMHIIDSTQPGQRLDVEYTRQAHVQVVLQRGREHEVARRPVDDRTTEEVTPDTRRDNYRRDSDAPDRNQSDRPNRGILPWRRN